MSVSQRLRETAEEYRADTDEDRPLAGYVGILVAYCSAVAVASLVGRRKLPGFLPARELALGSIATYKIARVLTENPITSPLRAPFVRYEGVAGPAELAEETRGSGWRHAVGELLTCPFCVGQWVATSLVVGMTVLPRFTRTFMSVLVMVTASDFLQLAYLRAQRSLEE